MATTTVFLPRESHGQRSLAGCSPWGPKESDMTEATEHAGMHTRCLCRTCWCLVGQSVTQSSPETMGRGLPVGMSSAVSSAGVDDSKHGGRTNMGVATGVFVTMC